MRYLGFLVMAAACRREPPSARHQLLARISGDARIIAVAEGRAISHSRLRGTLDAVAARWPATMGCVLEAAFTSEQTGVAVDAAGNTTVLVMTHAEVKCPALSKVEPGLWLATIGAGGIATGASALDASRLTRARPYLESAPIAGVALGSPDLIATAQPDPLEAWLAIDAGAGADRIEKRVSELLSKMTIDPSTRAIAERLHSERHDGQIVIKLDAGTDGDLAIAARTVLGWTDEHARAPNAVFTCPAPPTTIACTGGTSFRLGSLAQLTAIVTDGKPTPIVANGIVTGLRLEANVAPLGLVTGDVVIAVDGRLVTSRAMLSDQIQRAKGATTVTVRRRTSETVLHFDEH